MRDITALQHIRPFIATPSYSGAMTTAYVRSLLALVNLAWARGFPMQTRFLDGDSLIPRARNRLAAEFLADARWTHLLWIDADIGFEPEAVLRLLLADREVVAGAYPYKADGWPAAGLPQPLPAGLRRTDFDTLTARFPVSHLTPPAAADADGFVEVRHAPTGFMLIARSALERMARELPELRYTADPLSDGTPAPWPHYRFFDIMVEPDGGRYLSEDFAFCERWRGLGGRVFIDGQSDLVHHGAHGYRGRFDRSTVSR